MTHKIVLIGGNGLTLSYYQHRSGQLEGWHPSQPLSWPIPNPSCVDQLLLDALPNFAAAIDVARVDLGNASDFEIFRHVLARARTTVTDVSEQRSRRLAEIEARHFLALAYSHLHFRLASIGPSDWIWCSWLQQVQQSALYAVSFNYDLLLELALISSGRTIALGGVETGTVVFKPHGSINYDLARGMFAVPLGYPLQFEASWNDGQVAMLAADMFLTPRQEPVCVLPTEASSFANTIWNRGRFQEYAGIAPQATHCVIVGISYHDSDRREINFLIDQLSRSTRVHVVDPCPSEALVAALRTRGFELTVSDVPPTIA